MIKLPQVGRFEIRSFLGRGAIGDVYLAWDPEQEREVALKVVNLGHRDREMLQAERNGISLQRQLAERVPQVAAVYEQGEDDELFWVAMEYVAGTDLSEVLAAGPLSEPRAIGVAIQLCAMLEACQRFEAAVEGQWMSAIVHGDIKPENIRLQDGDRVRVFDFGIAKKLSRSRGFTVNLFGTPPYTPPERLDRGAVDLHSDLWAVGVILYLMVSGRPPFSGGREDLEEKIRRGDRPEPLPAEVSAKLKTVIQKSLAFKVARRYPDAAAMRADLEACRDGLPLPSEAAPSPAPDLNLTRRTTQPLAASGDPEAVAADLPPPLPRDIPKINETRRTGELPPPPAAFSLEPAAAAPAAPEAPRPRRRWFLALVGVLALFILCTQVWVRGEAREIERELVATPAPDLDALWARYQHADHATLGLGIGLGAAREELRAALLQQADRVLESWHGDSPRTTEHGWEKAHHYLRAALDLDYDRETRARMIYTQAHLDRIAAQSLRASGQKEAADKKVEDAVAGFRDAARRDPKWPDPYLGLARIYSYETFDLNALQAAIGELGRRGYPLGRREKAMLADGFRRQGMDLEMRATKATRPEDRIQLLEHARDAFNQALNFYAEIPNYAGSRANRADTVDHLEAIQAELAPPPSDEPAHAPSHARKPPVPKLLREIIGILRHPPP